MANRSKQLGTLWETAIVRYLTENGFHARRQPLAGSEDKGDVIVPEPRIIIEAKNCAKLEFAKWIREAELEASRTPDHEGVVWAKQRGKASPGDGYVVLSGESFLDLLRRFTVYPTNDGTFQDRAVVLAMESSGQ